MSKEHSPSPPMRTEQKIARRIAICVVLPLAMIWSAAVHLAREPRSAWRLIVMDAQMQIQVAKGAWARWWEF
jgi:hypothetical protein